MPDKPDLPFRCLACNTGSLEWLNSDQLRCNHCSLSVRANKGRPIIFREDNELFSQTDYVGLKSSVQHPSVLARLVPSPSVNLSQHRVLTRLGHELEQDSTAMVLVVGSGKQREGIGNTVNRSGNVSIVHCDIDVNADVDLYCDGHDLPFFNGQFDAVITTAVLEHVLDPFRVVAEIGRVTRPGGYIYSELPFMQQVHEGAYDFFRTTLSGHRWLFRHYEEIESGIVAGPGTALVWSIENFLLAFFSSARSRALAKGVTRGLFFWIKYFDHVLTSKPAAADGASCTYYFGRKSESLLTPRQLIEIYVGAKHLSHV